MMHLFATAMCFCTSILYTLVAAAQFPAYNHVGDCREPLKQIYQFPNLTWVENIAVRANGKLLVTLITSPEVWQIDPSAVPVTAELVVHFPKSTSLLGITEFAEDVFAVAVGTFNTSDITGTLGSWSIWGLDMHGGDTSYDRRERGKPDCDIIDAVDATAYKITNIPEATFLNGMTSIPDTEIILIADSVFGVIFYVNTNTGEYGTAIDNPAFKPSPNAAVALGINGIQIDHDEPRVLYYSTSFQPHPLLGRLPIAADGSAAGPVEVVLQASPFPEIIGSQADDFALKDGNAWITQDPSSSILLTSAIDGSMNVTLIAGSTTERASENLAAGSTAAQFGRLRRDQDILYVTTNGGMPTPENGIVGGRILSLNTICYLK